MTHDDTLDFMDNFMMHDEALFTPDYMATCTVYKCLVFSALERVEQLVHIA